MSGGQPAPPEPLRGVRHKEYYDTPSVPDILRDTSPAKAVEEKNRPRYSFPPPRMWGRC